MNDQDPSEPKYQKALYSMGILVILGLLSGLVFLMKYSPLTMLLFMTGQVAIFLAVLVYVYVVIKDLRRRKVL